jgi:hypothetical protein
MASFLFSAWYFASSMSINLFSSYTITIFAIYNVYIGTFLFMIKSDYTASEFYLFNACRSKENFLVGKM